MLDNSAIVAVVIPSNGIVVYIISNTIHFILVANDVVVKTWLPRKRKIFFVGIFGDTNFESPNDGCQVSGLGTEFL